MIKSRTPEEEELHRLRNKIYSMSLSLRAAKTLLERGEANKALRAIDSALRDAELRTQSASEQ